MKSTYIIYTALLAVALLFINCANSPAPDPANKWFEETKTEILKQADHKPDSVVTVKNNNAKRETLTNGNIIIPDTTLIFENAYFNGRLFHKQVVKEGKLRAEIFYSNDGAFELRKEFYGNGVSLFEGIAYNSHFYGPFTWHYENGKIKKQGIRFRDQKIGMWRDLDETGEKQQRIDYRNLDKIDSLPKLVK